MRHVVVNIFCPHFRISKKATVYGHVNLAYNTISTWACVVFGIFAFDKYVTTASPLCDHSVRNSVGGLLLELQDQQRIVSAS